MSRLLCLALGAGDLTTVPDQLLRIGQDRRDGEEARPVRRSARRPPASSS